MGGGSIGIENFISERAMKKLMKLAIAATIILVSVTACRPQYVFFDPDLLPGHGGNSTPPVTITEEDMTKAESEAEEYISDLKTDVPKLPAMGVVDKNDGCEYKYDNSGNPTARYGTFLQIFGIDGFIDVGVMNEPVESVMLVGKSYTANDSIDVSVGNSNFVRDKIFKVENQRLKINMFYFYSSIVFGDGIYVNGTRLEEYDGLFENAVDEEVSVDEVKGEIQEDSSNNAKAEVQEIRDNEFEITFKVSKDDPEVVLRYTYWAARANDIVFTKNSASGIAFDYYANDADATGAYPFGWTVDYSKYDNVNRTEHIETMVLRDNKILHYDFTLHLKVELV